MIHYDVFGKRRTAAADQGLGTDSRVGPPAARRAAVPLLPSTTAAWGAAIDRPAHALDRMALGALAVLDARSAAGPRQPRWAGDRSDHRRAPRADRSLVSPAKLPPP
jgi:hypothetical protein